jgi:hypothetical protein
MSDSGFLVLEDREVFVRRHKPLPVIDIVDGRLGGQKAEVVWLIKSSKKIDESNLRYDDMYFNNN